MTLIVADAEEERRLRRHRRITGADRWDEVWNGVYFMSPLPNNQHQNVATRIASALEAVIQQTDRGLVFAGCNVSDRRTGWKKNYRCPDIAVFLRGNAAEDCGTHWFGGPDLAVEIVSPQDRSRRKLPFYARVGTREVLILDRDPWRLELHRLDGDAMTLVGAATVEGGETVRTDSVPFAWRLVAGAERPQVEMTSTESERRWTA